MRVGAVLGVLLFFGGAGAGFARAAEPSASCTVRIIHALHEGHGIDPKITRLRPYLEKAPFTAWKHFELLENKELQLLPTASQAFPLPNGRQAQLTYLEHVERPDGKHRLRLRLAISNGAKRSLDTTFIIDEGGVVLEAGQKHLQGLLILGISCTLPH